VKEEDLIQTSSRCQILHFNGLSEPIITEALVSREDQSNIAAKIAHQAQEITTLHCSMPMMKNIL
jgi:DNA polymerase-3 subunit delta'